MENLEGVEKMLVQQVDKLFRHINVGSIKTRYRYKDAETRFCKFLAENYQLRKIKNVSVKHLYAYTEQLADGGKSQKYILTELSGIRFFHDYSGSRNLLPDNEKIKNNLKNKSIEVKEKTTGKIDRAWNVDEITCALIFAQSKGHIDIYYAIKMSSLLGLRLEEAVRCKVEHINNAISNGKLYVRGKGGQVRYIPITTADQRNLLQDLIVFSKSQGCNKNNFILSTDTKSEKQRIDSFIYRNQHHFINTSNRLMPISEEGKKPMADKLNFHGLRYYYAQVTYKDLQKSGLGEHAAKIKVSEYLGHHREQITSIYLDTFTKQMQSKLK